MTPYGLKGQSLSSPKDGTLPQTDSFWNPSNGNGLKRLDFEADHLHWIQFLTYTFV